MSGFLSAGLFNAIPDSRDLHARYDATAISAADGDRISTWGDETDNGFNLTAGKAATFEASTINGNPAVQFNGIDEFLDVSWTTISDPLDIYFVAEVVSSSTSWGTALTGVSNANQFYGTDSNDNFGIFRGSNFVSGSAGDTNPHVFSFQCRSGNDILRVDGAEDINSDTGSNGLEGLTVGSVETQGNYANINMAEILVYPQDKSGIESDIEQYLADKWDITI